MLMIYKSPYDESPIYAEVVVRTWSHDYGGPDGFTLFATVWVPERNAFCDYCYKSHRSGDGQGFEDASDDVRRRWNALSEVARTPLPPATKPGRCVLLDRLYGS
jgi:hypothetical protein